MAFDNFITQVIVQLMAIIFIPAIIIAIIQWLVDGECTYDDTPSRSSDSGGYQHEDAFGAYSGRSVRKGNKIESYDEWGNYLGYSERREDGTLIHYDVLGTELGRSKKKP